MDDESGESIEHTRPNRLTVIDRATVTSFCSVSMPVDFCRHLVVQGLLRHINDGANAP